MWSRIKRNWPAPVFEDEALARTARLLNVTLLLILGASVMMLIVTLWLGGLPAALDIASPISTALIIIIAVGGFFVLAHYGRIWLTSVLLLLMLWFLTTAWIVGRIGITTSNSILTLAVIVVLSGLLLGGRGAIVFTLLGSLTVLTGYTLQSMGYLAPRSASVSPMDLFFLITQLGLIGLLLRYATNSITDAVQRAQTHAQAQRQVNRELTALRATLERRIAERTRDLERQTTQLQLAAQVGRVATSTLDAEQLLSEVTNLLYDRLDLYHVSFFETDPTGRWAIYRTGAGPGVEDLAQARFRLEIGGNSLIGQCIAHSRLRVNQDIGLDDRPHQPHPLLPDTRSEAAFPLIARGQVIGAMDVQSDRPQAFDQKTIASLQTIADQVAIALDNARLLRESQQALEATRLAYGELTRQAWNDLLRGRSDWGYRYTYRAVDPMTGDWSPEMLQALESGQRVQREVSGEAVLAIPLRVRDQTVGVLSFYKPLDEAAWMPDEIAALERIIQQMGMALESAQFYEESQQRAWRERIAREVTARMRESLDVDMVLRTSLQEIRQTLGLESMTIRLIEPTEQA